MAPVLAAEKAGWAPATGEPLLEPLRELFEPIMAQSDQICDGIGYPVELRMGTETVVLDFPKRAVREPIPDEKFRYGFGIAPELVRTVLRDNEPDWVNTIFLSTRFTAWRVGGYNEYLYTFFKCLTDERIAYADGWFAEAHDDSASITLDGWEIQRRCPHLKADLSKFGVVEGDTLTGGFVVSKFNDRVEFFDKLNNRVVNFIPVDDLSDVAKWCDDTTQTVGLYPEARRAGLRDAFALAGVQRLVSLAGGDPMTVYANSHHMPPGSPHDGIEPMRRSVRWVVDMQPAAQHTSLDIAAE